MQRSNYDTMHLQMREEFLKYDQQQMIRRFRLRHDEEWLYLRFCGQPYRVERKSAAVFRPDGSPAGYNEVMTIYDYLCHCDSAGMLSGVFSPVNSLKGLVQSTNVGDSLFKKNTSKFAGRAEALKIACQRLGGSPERMGDVAYRLPVFDFLPIILRFYDADEEFPAEIQFLWDENTLQFMHYETTYFATGHLTKVLLEEMDKAEK